MILYTLVSTYILIVMGNILLLYVANVGDSRAYVCKRGKDQEIACVLLTKDHNPTNVSICFQFFILTLNEYIL